jgi:DNA-binding response OmpR family regulator
MAEEKPRATILIADDESEIREILSIHVAGCGFDFVEAEDGQRAIEIIRSQKIDVVISDIMMPRMSGMMFLRSLREEGFNCPFIFVTAYPSKEATVEALRLGAFDFLEKPFESEEIVKLVKEAVRVAQERSELIVSRGTGTAERGSKSQTNSVENKILSIRALRYRGEADSTNSAIKSAEKARMIELFLAEAIPQLVFSEASAKGLSDTDARTWELGYLFRVMQGIRVAAEAIGLKQIEQFSGAIEGCFTFFRVCPSLMAQGHIDLMTLAVPALRDMISVAGSEIQMNPDVVAIKERVFGLLQDLSVGQAQEAG